MNNQALANSCRPAKPAKVIKTLFTDKSLTKKATFNAFAALLDYGARLIVVLIITPFLVAGLGSYFFGTCNLNRLIGYISPTSGPSQALNGLLPDINHPSIRTKRRTSAAQFWPGYVFARS